MAKMPEGITKEILAATLGRGRGKVSIEIDGCHIDDVWATGSRAWFEYHRNEFHEWPDAPAWYHSHQQVEVLGLVDCATFTTFRERMDAGFMFAYRVRFDDGLEWDDVWEDELLTDPSQFNRPDPPKPRMEKP